MSGRCKIEGPIWYGPARRWGELPARWDCGISATMRRLCSRLQFSRRPQYVRVCVAFPIVSIRANPGGTHWVSVRNSVESSGHCPFDSTLFLGSLLLETHVKFNMNLNSSQPFILFDEFKLGLNFSQLDNARWALANSCVAK